LVLTINSNANLISSNTFQDQSVSCHGNHDGSCLTVAIPNGNYSYVLDGGIQTNTIGFFSGLAPGIHTVCTTNGIQTICDTVMIDEPDALQIQFVIDSLVSCHGNDGAISTNITGGTATLQSYLTWWTNANGDTLNDVITNSFATSLYNLNAGSIHVTIEDDHGCFYSDSTILNSEIPLNLNISNTNITCSGGTSVLSVSYTGGSWMNC
jgi:hypothetical protein